MLRRALPVIVALGLLLGVAPAGIAEPAAGGAKAGRTTATITFSANPVTVGSEYQIIGTGFGANRWVTVGAHYDGWIYWVSGVTDASGRIVLTTTARSVGDSYHEAKEQGNNGSLRLKATATLSVVG